MEHGVQNQADEKKLSTSVYVQWRGNYTAADRINTQRSLCAVTVITTSVYTDNNIQLQQTRDPTAD